jgi:hypothetical protein
MEKPWQTPLNKGPAKQRGEKKEPKREDPSLSQKRKSQTGSDEQFMCWVTPEVACLTVLSSFVFIGMFFPPSSLHHNPNFV